MKLRVVFNTLTTLLQPVRRGEIDGFSKVVTLIETGMIRSWKRDDKLASEMVSAVNRHTSVSQSIGIQDCHKLMKQIGLTYLKKVLISSLATS